MLCPEAVLRVLILRLEQQQVVNDSKIKVDAGSAAAITTVCASAILHAHIIHNNSEYSGQYAPYHTFQTPTAI